MTPTCLARGDLVALLLATSLSACANTGPIPFPPLASAEHGADHRDAAPTEGSFVIQGALIYREPVVLPPEAMARVQLVRLGPNRVARGVLSTVWVAGPMTPPVPFRLTWTPKRTLPLATDEQLAVVAMVMVDDEVIFTSLAPGRLHFPVYPRTRAATRAMGWDRRVGEGKISSTAHGPRPLPPRAESEYWMRAVFHSPRGGFDNHLRLKRECPFMSTVMIKVAGEGLVAKAHRLAEPGPTTGSSIIYEVSDVPEGLSAEDVVARFKGFKAPQDRYEIAFSELPA